MLNPLLASLDWSTRLEGNVIHYTFLKEGTQLDLDDEDDGPSTKVLEGWTAYEQQQARLALSLFAAVTPLTFVEVDDPAQADLRFALFDFEEPGLLGWAIPPGEDTFGQASGLAAFNFTSPRWDREAGGSLDQGGYGFITLTHEFGHLFGLSHPHDTADGLSTMMPGVIVGPYHGNGGSTGDFELNQGIYTMMSYNDGWPTGPMPLSTSLAWGWATGPMALDVAVLQYKYGVNTDAGAAGTIYDLADADGPGVGYEVIWNTYGDNVIRYEGARNAVINLQPATLQSEWGGGGSLSFVHGVHGGYTIAHGVEITTAISGSGDDILFGNAMDNMFDPGAGKNQVFGNGGFNTVVYGGARTDYSIDYDDGVWGIEADDGTRLDVLHQVRGVQFDDTLFLIEAVADSSLIIGTMYLALLARAPDAQGFQHWTSAAFEGIDLGRITQDIGASDEFAQTRGLLDDRSFVESLYDTILDREGDADGLAYWTGSLSAGDVTRADIALSFGMSDEFDGANLDGMLDHIAAFGDLWA